MADDDLSPALGACCNVRSTGVANCCRDLTLSIDTADGGDSCLDDDTTDKGDLNSLGAGAVGSEGTVVCLEVKVAAGACSTWEEDACCTDGSEGSLDDDATGPADDVNSPVSNPNAESSGASDVRLDEVEGGRGWCEVDTCRCSGRDTEADAADVTLRADVLDICNVDAVGEVEGGIVLVVLYSRQASVQAVTRNCCTYHRPTW